MAEIEAREPNGLNVVSTFSGCGGSCLGFKMSGYRALWANEFIPQAAEVYRANHPGVHVDGSDIRDVSAGTIREVIGDARVDVLEGSPPCSSFSFAGSGAKGWGAEKHYSHGRHQRTDDLVFEFARLVGEVQPRAVVMENVSNLAQGKAVGYFRELTARFTEVGYRTAARVLDASWLGVPQARKRLILVGFRNDLDLDPVFPTPLPYRYTITEAFEPPGVIEDGPDISGYAIGREAARLNKITPPGRKWKSNKYLNLLRPTPGRPCPTITAQASSPGVASVIHPAGTRKFSISEVKRLCGFPDDFALPDHYATAVERLGRAVPPPMMAAVSAAVAEALP